ncbi:L,D-transpeptidase [Gordonia crocea]|uniref:Putative conserved lipoprotein LppS n=1 Tax=Gordonia crocea TaxID=589162 RepID=A0A7I9UX33_9ACTN|nr:Ig-like domain-containing protein [Gordonia crocea]GED97503.1 putative conserved lipoprotein LppS [Gordonia crocea]
MGYPRGGTRGGRAPFVVLAALIAMVGMLSSCTKSPTYPDTVSDSSQFADLAAPALTVTGLGEKALKENAIGVQPGAPVTVRAQQGSLTNVKVSSGGREVPGQITDNGSTWTNTAPMAFASRYTLTARATGVGGQSDIQRSFTTSTANNFTMPYLVPRNGEVVGVGQPISVKFDEPITNRKAVQDAIVITTDPPVEGAFYWISPQDLRWRPEKFWKSGTKVTVAVNVFGIDLGDGVYGQKNVKSTFRVGRQMLITADDRTKTVTFERDGKVVRRMPTSMGKPGTPTDRGIYIVGDKHAHLVMDSSTYGVPINSADGYRTPVDYATQMSYSGIYFHSAPWSVWAQGNTNTSHGCLNLSPADALWVMNNTLRGDPVTVKHTQGPMLSGTDGLGDWNIPWERWKKGNA